MVINYDSLTEEQVAIYELLETLRRFSSCKDKQVAAIATDSMGKILSVSYNQPQDSCDLCEADVHPTGCAVHAEQGLALQRDALVYLTTFPCKDCQMMLWSKGIERVFVYGEQHKEDIGLLDIVLLPDVASILLTFNGIDKQKTVVMGELGELITAIADSMRKDTKDNRSLLDEIIDVELQLKCLRRCINPVNLINQKYYKYSKLIRKFK